MPATEIKRPNFYEGQYLGAADLVAAQEYQRQQDQRHRLAAHTWGIAAGLELDERAPQGSGSSGAVDVFIKPGYAVDGFGRAIVVLEPLKIAETLFAQFTFGSGPPDGRWIPVWLRYQEKKTNPPGPGFVTCEVEDQAFRVLETFRVVVGELLSTSQQRDQIAVAGMMIDAESELPDASVPYQALPESGDADRWLIPVGSVRWLAPNPPATTAGHFVKSVSDDEKKRAREGRQYIGVVAETVWAPAGKLRIRDRKNPTPLAEIPELVGIEGSLYVSGNTGIRQNKLYLSGGEGWSSLSYNAHHDAANQNWAFPDTTRTAVTVEMDDKNGPRFEVWNTTTSAKDKWKQRLAINGDSGNIAMAHTGGNVGIGTSAPAFKLDVAGVAHASSFSTTSDDRFKTNIRPLENVLDKVEQIRGITFEWNEKYAALGRATGKTELGVLAQGIEAVFPELVSRWGDEQHLAVDYGRLSAVLLEGVKELAAQNSALSLRIRALEKQVGPARKRPRQKS